MHGCVDATRVPLPCAPALATWHILRERINIATALNRRCPHCKSERVNWSRSKGYERVARFAGVGYYRCRECGRRFVAFRWWGQNQIKVICSAVAFLVLIFVFWRVIKFVSLLAEQ